MQIIVIMMSGGYRRLGCARGASDPGGQPHAMMCKRWVRNGVEMNALCLGGNPCIVQIRMYACLDC